MEAIALGLGAASFLVDAFDKSLQAYNIYTQAKNLGSISAHLHSKLLIEEQRLVQWGEGVGLKRTGNSQWTENSSGFSPSPRLSEGGPLYDVVLQTLANIELTLTNVEELTARYGVQILD